MTTILRTGIHQNWHLRPSTHTHTHVHATKDNLPKKMLITKRLCLVRNLIFIKLCKKRTQNLQPILELAHETILHDFNTLPLVYESFYHCEFSWVVHPRMNLYVQCALFHICSTISQRETRNKLFWMMLHRATS